MRSRESVPVTGLLLLWCALLIVAPGPLAAQSGEPWVAPERRAARANPLQPTADHIAEGKKLYTRECASCHGATGKNDGAQAPKEMPQSRKLTDPTLWNESDGALFWKIAEGRRPMPSTLDVLNDRERWQIVLYIRTLAPRPDAANRPTGR
jgi:mono/diheme cytochrome c family protein